MKSRLSFIKNWTRMQDIKIKRLHLTNENLKKAFRSFKQSTLAQAFKCSFNI